MDTIETTVRELLKEAGHDPTDQEVREITRKLEEKYLADIMDGREPTL